jgi:hypothetical protein
MSAIADHPPATIASVVLASIAAFALTMTFLPSTLFLGDRELPAPIRLKRISLPSLDIAPFEHYGIVFEKPLFNPGHEPDPAPAAEAAKSALPALSGYRLAGLVLAGRLRMALVERRDAKQTITLHIGDDLDGRRVEDITAEGVRLSNGSARELLAVPRVNGVSRRNAGGGGN